VTKRNLPLLISVLFTLAVVVTVGSALDWKSAVGTLKHVDLLWLGAALVIFSINYALRTLRFLTLLHAPELSVRKLAGVTTVYGMFNYLLPAKSGELTYVVLINRYLPIDIPHAAATLISARFFDFGVIALVLPVVLVAFYRVFPGTMIQASILYLVIVSGAVVGLLVYLRRSRPRSSQSGWSKMVQGLRIIDQRRQYPDLLVLTGGIWLCVYTNFYCIVASIGYEPSFIQMIVVSIILVPLTLLPVQGVANIGTHEAAWVAAFSLFGEPLETSLRIAVTTHVVLFVFVLILGGVGYALLQGDSQ